VQKTYIALVHGQIVEESGEINVPLGRLPGGKFGEVHGGREAKTLYKLTENLVSENGEFSLVEVYPKTGRTHQIRVHMKAIHHPLVSDKLYVGRKNYRKDIKWCPRLFLHAKSICFFNPADNKKVEVKSNIPNDLDQVLQSFSR
jgi:23S rRNA pseudouridine1911/1915/1917 synthase